MTEDEMVGWRHRLKQSALGEMVRDREAWLAAVHGVTKSQTRLSLVVENDKCLGQTQMMENITEAIKYLF